MGYDESMRTYTIFECKLASERCYTPRQAIPPRSGVPGMAIAKIPQNEGWSAARRSEVHQDSQAILDLTQCSGSHDTPASIKSLSRNRANRFTLDEAPDIQATLAGFNGYL